MQVVGYNPAVENPAQLLIADREEVISLALTEGAELAYTLGPRHCGGALDGERHLSCDAEKTPHCPEHTDRWPCARCQGDCDLPLESCREEHAIYLAGFAPDAFKVGVTRSWRLERRLREQGADRGVHIRSVENGKIARQIEADIATEVGDSVRTDRKRKGLHHSFDRRAWRELTDSFDVRQRFSFEYGLDIRERPVEETLLAGTVLGTKGRILVLEFRGSTYAVDMRDLVGHEMSKELPNRDVQSSLVSFE